MDFPTCKLCDISFQTQFYLHIHNDKMHSKLVLKKYVKTVHQSNQIIKVSYLKPIFQKLLKMDVVKGLTFYEKYFMAASIFSLMWPNALEAWVKSTWVLLWILAQTLSRPKNSSQLDSSQFPGTAYNIVIKG